MAIELQKMGAGERINLSKSHNGLKKLKIGLSWDVKEGVEADLDASLLVLGDNEKMLKDDSIVFYNNLHFTTRLSNTAAMSAGAKKKAMTKRFSLI